MGISADCITYLPKVRGADEAGNETSASCVRSIRPVSFYKQALLRPAVITPGAYRWEIQQPDPNRSVQMSAGARGACLYEEALKMDQEGQELERKREMRENIFYCT